jgi:molybdate transport system substrate-binding protein
METLQMPVFKKGVLIMVSLLTALLLAAGCNGTSAPSTPSPGSPVELTVCAGVGLIDVLTAINKLYMQENKYITIITNFASAGTLQEQIEQGAPADVFFSPGVKQMQQLQDGGFIINETRVDKLTNKVVLVAPVNSSLDISDFMDLVNDDVKRISIGDPESVPAGDYSKQALEQLGIYEQVKPKLILCADVRQVLGYVEAGNVDAGLVYATDAAITDSVKIVADAPTEINGKISYPAAVIKASKNVAAAIDYISFLFSDEIIAVFQEYGFVVRNN